VITVSGSLPTKPPNWNFSDGSGSTSAQRHAEKSQLALSVLVDRLAATEAFWDDVRSLLELPPTPPTIRQQAAEKLAKEYGRGRRRTSVIAALLVRAARTGDEDGGLDEFRAVQALWRRAFFAPLERGGTRGTYRYRPEYLALLKRGAELVSLRRTRQCFECRTLLRRGNRDYCSIHQPHGGLAASDHERRSHAITEVFRLAFEAMVAAGWIHRET
jgi:hypothetical protein